MSIKDNADLKSIRDDLIKEMLEYRADGNASYTEADVEECRRILEKHLESVCSAKDRDSALECVKTTVLKLNKLNEKAGDELIETGQREDICKYIIRAGALLGFNGEDEDITEEWREW